MTSNLNNEILISKINAGVHFCEESLNTQIVYYLSVIGMLILGYFTMGYLNKNYLDIPSSSIITITKEENEDEDLNKAKDANKKYITSPESRTEIEMKQIQEDMDFFLN